MKSKLKTKIYLLIFLITLITDFSIFINKQIKAISVFDINYFSDWTIITLNPGEQYDLTTNTTSLADQDILFQVNGDATITGKRTEGNTYFVVNNNAKLTVKDVTITNTSKQYSSYKDLITFVDGGSLIFEGNNNFNDNSNNGFSSFISVNGNNNFIATSDEKSNVNVNFNYSSNTFGIAKTSNNLNGNLEINNLIFNINGSIVPDVLIGANRSSNLNGKLVINDVYISTNNADFSNCVIAGASGNGTVIEGGIDVTNFIVNDTSNSYMMSVGIGSYKYATINGDINVDNFELNSNLNLIVGVGFLNDNYINDKTIYDYNHNITVKNSSFSSMRINAGAVAATCRNMPNGKIYVDNTTIKTSSFMYGGVMVWEGFVKDVIVENSTFISELERITCAIGTQSFVNTKIENLNVKNIEIKAKEIDCAVGSSGQARIWGTEGAVTEIQNINVDGLNINGYSTDSANKISVVVGVYETNFTSNGSSKVKNINVSNIKVDAVNIGVGIGSFSDATQFGSTKMPSFAENITINNNINLDAKGYMQLGIGNMDTELDNKPTITINNDANIFINNSNLGIGVVNSQSTDPLVIKTTGNIDMKNTAKGIGSSNAVIIIDSGNIQMLDVTLAPDSFLPILTNQPVNSAGELLFPFSANKEWTETVSDLDSYPSYTYESKSSSNDGFNMNNFYLPKRPLSKPIPLIPINKNYVVNLEANSIELELPENGLVVNSSGTFYMTLYTFDGTNMNVFEKVALDNTMIKDDKLIIPLNKALDNDTTYFVSLDDNAITYFIPYRSTPAIVVDVSAPENSDYWFKKVAYLTCKIIYNPNAPKEEIVGDLPIDNTEYTNGSVITIKSTNLQRTNYNFVGWATKDNPKIYNAGDSITVNNNSIELFAQWSVVSTNYKPSTPSEYIPDTNSEPYLDNAKEILSPPILYPSTKTENNITNNLPTETTNQNTNIFTENQNNTTTQNTDSAESNKIIENNATQQTKKANPKTSNNNILLYLLVLVVNLLCFTLFYKQYYKKGE